MSDRNTPPDPQYPGAGGPQNPNQYGTQRPPVNAQGNQQAPWQQPGQYGQPGPQQAGQQQPGPQYGGRPGPQYGQPGPQHPGPQYGGQPQQPGPQYVGQPQQPGPQYVGQPQYGQPGGQSAYEQLHVGRQPPQGPGNGPGQRQWQPAPKKKRGKLVPLIAALAMVLVVAGGGIFAYGKLNGGKQPAAVLPGNAIAYARVDLNPSAGQKVAAIRFMLKFPSVKENLGLTGEQDDLRQKLFESIKKYAGDDLADVDYENDVKPWLGERAGLAALPAADGGDEPDVVVAVEVKNEDEATKGLDKLFATEDEKPGRAFSNGYVLLGDDQAVVDQAVATSKDNPLEKNARFSADMDALGEQGFASVWADMKGIAGISGKVRSEQLAGISDASMAAALRFDASYVELKGIVHGDRSTKVDGADAGELIGQLPDTTAAALAVSGGENLVDTMWKQLEKASNSNIQELTEGITEETGLKLPDDLKILLGRNLAVAIDKNAGNGPKIAARMKTDPAKAEPVVEKLTTLLRRKAEADIPIETAKDGDSLVVATDQSYAEQVLTGGNLGGTENFTQALPDTKGAVAIGYLDFEAAGSLSKRFSSDKDLSALRTGGYVVRSTDNGEAEFSLRVVAK
ncbi:DUF3352 domain-containing protein [Kribbella turkmenica]|uniref:DUF3352 domain-containing protein n=1 Tax=Kribbella turkmenica TaxID=2530375 RepID=A0A4R4XI45_9ACTN|nr:DUF3352 domain-containing protein [Kribbella turkmenica]TDD30339.1 DUF3352 domain-containing protein [Kribbella turkmenica]